MSGKSTKIAVGGVFSALCLLLMLMSGMVPFSTYAIPALAGAMLIAVLIEAGRKAAVMVYISVSLLSIFAAPDKEAAMIFVSLCGYYPLLKEWLEQLSSRMIEYILKFAVFNAAIVLGYAAITRIFGFPSITVDDMGTFGRYTALVLLLAGNVVFFIYDIALTRFIFTYLNWFRPKFLRR